MTSADVQARALEPPAWLEVAGFKSIHDPQRLVLRPLTLLAGGNSSGKSSMMQPLLLLKQSLETPYNVDALQLSGAHLNFTSLDQLLSRAKRKDSCVGRLSVMFGSLPQGPRPSPRCDVKFDLVPGVNDRLSPEVFVRRTDTARWIAVRDDERDALLELAAVPSSEVHDVRLSVSSSGLHTSLTIGRVSNYPMPEPSYLRVPVNEPLEWTRSILHLPGHRGHRDRLYPQAHVTFGPRGEITLTGPAHHYAPSLLYRWGEEVSAHAISTVAKASSKATLQGKLEQVGDALKKLELTWKVQAKQAGGGMLTVHVGRMPRPARAGARDLVEIADAGYGVSQVLPVLVALVAAIPGQMVLIEQPELHLHPRAQLALGSVLAEAATRGVIVVVETHSQLILRAIQTVVARGSLEPDQVGLHWFGRSTKTGWTEVTLAEVGHDGSFGDWPVDFPDVYAMADSEFIDAVFAAGGPV